MPMREKYFAQPPIELLRQWMDHKGWYDRAPPCAFKTVVDVILVGCMGPPGGGRNPVSNRALRHFNFLSFTDMSDKSLVRIFDSILGATLVKKFQPEIAALSATFVEASRGGHRRRTCCRRRRRVTTRSTCGTWRGCSRLLRGPEARAAHERAVRLVDAQNLRSRTGW